MIGRRVGLLLLTAGCAGAPTVPPDWFETASPPPNAAEHFPSAATTLSGFDEPVDAGRFRAGDRALLGLEFWDGDEVDRWTMLLEVVDPAVTTEGGESLIHSSEMTMTRTDGRSNVVIFRSEVLRLRATRFDEAGIAGEATLVDVPREALAAGLAHGCAAFHGWPGEHARPTDEQMNALARSVSSCQALLDVIQHDDLLSDILWQIARAPSMWSVVSQGGVDVSLRLPLDKAVPVDERSQRYGAAWRFPLEITANDEPVLLIVADVVEPRSPWNLAAGLVALSARRPGDDDIRLDVRLLAARFAPD